MKCPYCGSEDILIYGENYYCQTCGMTFTDVDLMKAVEY